MKVRFIRQPDLAPLMAAERSMSELPDGSLTPWALSAKDVLDVIRQRDDSEKGTYETRTYVVDDGEVVGGYAVERRQEDFTIVFLIARPGEKFDEAVRAMLDHAKDRAWRSKKRRKIVLYLRDRDEARLRELIPLVKGEGFAVKLAPDHFGECDGWECTYVVEE